MPGVSVVDKSETVVRTLAIILEDSGTLSWSPDPEETWPGVPFQPTVAWCLLPEAFAALADRTINDAHQTTDRSLLTDPSYTAVFMAF